MSKFSLILLCAAQFMVILDITVVSIALPSIQQDLGLATKDLQWVITAYTLAFGGLLLLGGRAADLFGRRRVFLTGLAVFTLASLGAALAGSAAALIAARVGQGWARRCSRPLRSRWSRRCMTKARRATGRSRRGPRWQRRAGPSACCSAAR